MKKIITFFLAVYSMSLMAQIPQGISYQAIAFTSGGTPVVTGNISVRISILDNSASGTVVYKETHAKTTNSKGLFNLNIGQGTPVTGTFSGINWATNSKFLKVEIDPTGGTTYTSVGTNQLMSVPFAFVAASVTNSGSNSISDQLLASKSSNIAIKDVADDKVYVFNSKTGVWSSQPYNGSYTPTLTAANGNFYLNDIAADTMYTFSAKTGLWSSQAYDGSYTPTIITDTLSGNIAINDIAADKVYVFNVNTGAWSSQAYNGCFSITVMGSKGNFAFNDECDDKVYAYNAKTGTWSSQAYNGCFSITLLSSNGNFYFNSSCDDKVFVFNAVTGSWSSQTYNGSYTPTLIVSSAP